MKQITIYEFLERNSDIIKGGWVAMDNNRKWWWYSRKPKPSKKYKWWKNYQNGECFCSLLIEKIDIAPFDGDWKDSLIKVEHKEEE